MAESNVVLKNLSSLNIVFNPLIKFLVPLRKGHMIVHFYLALFHSIAI